RERVGGSAVPDLMGGSPGAAADRYMVGSPRELLPLGVPQFLVHGEADDIVPVELSAGYAERARAAGDDARLVRLPRIGHFEVIDPATAAGRESVQALRNALKPRPA